MHKWLGRAHDPTRAVTMTPGYPDCLPPADFPIIRKESDVKTTCYSYRWSVALEWRCCPACRELNGNQLTAEEKAARKARIQERSSLWADLYEEHQSPDVKWRAERRERMHQRRAVRKLKRQTTTFLEGHDAHRQEEAKNGVPEAERIFLDCSHARLDWEDGLQ